MTYQTPHRIAALSFIKDGGSKVEAAHLFKVSRATIYRWLDLDDIVPKPPPKTRYRKIDKTVLKRHVQENPDLFLRERAAHFGVAISSMSLALSKMKVRKKKSVDI
ncbi:MAG: helix-turn-helix domain-containing protein [Alphaproteobacteria bacterium]|nr:helix-turn-helix domain-containing protein [Alphaproteobacteria bacterium]